MLERSWRRRRWPYPICLLPVQPWCLRLEDWLEFSDDRMICFSQVPFSRTAFFKTGMDWTCPVLTGKVLWRWYWWFVQDLNDSYRCMNEEIDLKQSTSTMAIVVAKGAKTTCFVTVLFMLAHWSPAINHHQVRKIIPKEETSPLLDDITFFNFLFMFGFRSKGMFPRKSCSLHPKQCFK